ncbi:hypothetical protein Y1Q_0014022 [Alligator mississippiensis]|uniref:Uncharacterized protein n=1 Tax=Alligator mississippiensis TaxID=8496 RepID=A0A151PDH2_ALLMI|nr:hypothetical protein Y1Q_0014022 [Alligator mississippiensis]
MATGSSAVKVTPNQKKVEQEEMIFRQVVVQAHHCLDSPLTSFKKAYFLQETAPGTNCCLLNNLSLSVQGAGKTIVWGT